MSPKQKEQIVKLIRNREPDKITLAIGDGSNDVDMISSAHIGVGIFGLEGSQAAKVSDFAFAKFYFLRRLLLVHGRECYRKNSTLLIYTFYKNILLIIPNFFFGISTMYSAQTLYETIMYQFYNILFCSFLITFFALADKEYKYKVLENQPKYYVKGMNGECFSGPRFWKWIIYGILQGTTLFLFIFFLNPFPLNKNGNNLDLKSLGNHV